MKINPSGIVPTDLAGYKTLVDDKLRSLFGTNVVLDDETVVGQLVGTLALALAQVDERAVEVVNGFNLNTAVGEQLDALGSVIALYRNEARSSTVTLTVTSTASTTIPAGSRVRATEGSPEFATDADVVLTGEGSATVNATAVETGLIEAAAGTLREIVNPVRGWSGVTNAAAAVPGRARETDTAYRRRFQTAYAHLGRDGLENIRSAVLNVNGVKDVRVEENNTAASVRESHYPVAIPAHSLYIVVDYQGSTAPVEGSALEERVGRAILESKPAGVGTVNSNTMGSSADVVLAHGGGGRGTTTINFDWVTRIPLQIELTATLTTGVTPSNWETLVKKRIIQWFDGNFSPGLDGQQLFDSSGLQIGESLDLDRLRSPIYSVPGVNLASGQPDVQRIATDTRLGTPQLNQRYTLEESQITTNGTYV